MSPKRVLRAIGIGGGMIGSSLLGSAGVLMSMPYLERNMNVPENIILTLNTEKENSDYLINLEKLQQQENEISDREELSNFQQTAISWEIASIQDLTSQLEQGKNDLKEKTQTLKNAKQKTQAQENDIKSNKEKITNLQDKLSKQKLTTQNTSTTNQTLIKEQREDLKKKEGELENLKETYEQQKVQLEQEGKNKIQTQSDLADKNSQLATAREENKTLNNQIDIEKGKVSTAQQEAKGYEESIKQREEDIKSKEAENEEQQKTISSNATTISNLQSQVSNYEIEIKKISGEITTGDREKTQNDAAITAHQTRIDYLKKSLDEKETELKNYQFQHVKNKSEIEKIQAEIKDLDDNSAIQRSEILTADGQKLNFLDIKIVEVKYTGERDNDKGSRFEIIDSNNSKQTKYFKDARDESNKKSIEDILANYSSKGFERNSIKNLTNVYDSIEIKTYKLCEKSTSESDSKNKQLWACDPTNQTVQLSTYFTDNYKKYASYALAALKQFANTGEIEVNEATGGDYTIKPSTYTDLTTQTTLDTSETVIWQNVFETSEDFIKYWILRTHDLVRTKRMNLSRMVSPILKQQ